MTDDTLDYQDPAVQRQIRAGFFNDFMSEPALVSVAVRRDENDEWFLDVGVTEPVSQVPRTYAGLAVRVTRNSMPRHAILLTDSGVSG